MKPFLLKTVSPRRLPSPPILIHHLRIPTTMHNAPTRILQTIRNPKMALRMKVSQRVRKTIRTNLLRRNTCGCPRQCTKAYYAQGSVRRPTIRRPTMPKAVYEGLLCPRQCTKAYYAQGSVRRPTMPKAVYEGLLSQLEAKDAQLSRKDDQLVLQRRITKKGP